MITLMNYHQKVRDYFKQQKKTWDYFNKATNKENQLLEFKNELLKNTYKFDPVTENFIYDNVAIAKEKLGLKDLPVTVYQSQHSDDLLNASIIYLNKEAHIVFSGSITKLLDHEELLVVLSHELSHVKLFAIQDGELEVADRIITSIANNYTSEPAYYETARLYRLYTEIFCDRGAYQVIGKMEPIITSLVKISTGLDKINAANYLKQANEIFNNDQAIKTEGFTHPENFIRARAIQLWHEKKELAEDEITKMIEGIVDIDKLDIFKQKQLTHTTLNFLQLFLKPKWIQTTLVLSQAKQYFPDFVINKDILLTEQFIDSTSKSHSSVKEYLGYLLLDFALLDASLEEIPMGWSFQFAEDVLLKNEYDAIIKKELKFSDKKLQQHKQKTLDAFYNVKEDESEQIYES